MPMQKITELLKELTVGNDTRIDDLLRVINSAKSYPEELSEAFILLFTVVDTNHKKNQKILSDVVALFLTINDKIEQKCSNGEAKKQTKASNVSKKNFILNLDNVQKTILATGTVISFLLIIVFVMYSFDEKAADKTTKAISTIEKNIKK